MKTDWFVDYLSSIWRFFFFASGLLRYVVCLGKFTGLLFDGLVATKRQLCVCHHSTSSSHTALQHIAETVATLRCANCGLLGAHSPSTGRILDGYR